MMGREARRGMNFIQKIEKDSLRDRVHGFLLGSFIGDSCGASVDAERYMPGEGQMVHCLKLGGGGRSHIGAGQVGHASEMQLTLLKVLVDTNKSIPPNQEYILDIDTAAREYSAWLQLDPFEYDTACNLALKNVTSAEQASTKAKKMNNSTMTSGALSRILPLAVWTSTLETSEEVKMAVVSDVELSHANPVVQELIFVYCDTIRFLLCNYNDEDRAQEAFNHAQELSEKTGYAVTKSKI